MYLTYYFIYLLFYFHLYTLQYIFTLPHKMDSFSLLWDCNVNKGKLNRNVLAILQCSCVTFTWFLVSACARVCAWGCCLRFPLRWHFSNYWCIQYLNRKASTAGLHVQKMNQNENSTGGTCRCWSCWRFFWKFQVNKNTPKLPLYSLFANPPSSLIYHKKLLKD